MKHPTPAYKELKVKLAEIRKILQRVPENNCISSLHHLKVKSYVLLSHAAFEEYIEQLSEMLLSESVNRYNKSQTINRCILGLVTFETVAQFDGTTSRKTIKAKVVNNLDKFINIAAKHHQVDIGANHGIRGKNQKALLLPLGIDPEETDSVTFAALDAFGAKRGGIAHKFKPTTNETKSSVQNDVTTIFNGLSSLDQEACKSLATKMHK